MKYKATNRKSYPIRVNKDGSKYEVQPGRSVILDYVPPSDHFDVETIKEKEEKPTTQRRATRRVKKKEE